MRGCCLTRPDDVCFTSLIRQFVKDDTLRTEDMGLKLLALLKKKKKKAKPNKQKASLIFPLILRQGCFSDLFAFIKLIAHFFAVACLEKGCNCCLGALSGFEW